nr:hypothetical protein [Tanacetum cinerariifolium]
MEINDELDDLKAINPYEIEEGELPPPPAESDTSFDASQKSRLRSGSSRRVFAPDPMGKDVDTLHHKVATRGLEAANRITSTEMKKLMTEEFCPAKEIQRMEHEL